MDSAETRSFLPPSVPRQEILELARGDIDNACTYVQTLRTSGADLGIVGFCALPLLLAHRNLELLEQSGPGAKITRGEVLSISNSLAEALATHRPFAVGGREVAAP